MLVLCHIIQVIPNKQETNGEVKGQDVRRRILDESSQIRLSKKLISQYEEKFKDTTFEYNEKTGMISW